MNLCFSIRQFFIQKLIIRFRIDFGTDLLVKWCTVFNFTINKILWYHSFSFFCRIYHLNKFMPNFSGVILEDNEIDEEYRVGSTEWWIKHGAVLILFTIGTVIGIFVNTLIIWIIAKNRRLGATQDYLVANTCVILLVHSVLVIPWMATFRVTRTWFFGESWCSFS